MVCFVWLKGAGLYSLCVEADGSRTGPWCRHGYEGLSSRARVAWRSTRQVDPLGSNGAGGGALYWAVDVRVRAVHRRAERRSVSSPSRCSVHAG